MAEPTESKIKERPMKKIADTPYLLLMIAAYVVAGILVTFPLVLNLSTHLYGLPGDGYGTLWSIWWNITHPIQWAAPAQPTLLAAAKFLTFAVNEVTTYNLLLLLSYPVAGIAIYLIVHYFTQNRAASFLAGLIYILGPYHIYQSYVHLSLAMIAWLPLYLYALLLWLKDPKIWRAAISGLLLSLVILDNYYYGYLAILVTIFFVFGLLLQIARNKLSFWTALFQGLVAAGLAIAIVSPFLIPSFVGGAVSDFQRPLREIFVFNARWWDFFIPPITHPLVGNLVQETTRFELSGSNYFERTLYLGYMPLILAIIAIWRRRQKWLTYLLISLFIVSIVLAVAPASIATVLHEWFPTFRVYSRFGLLSLMATAILAGIGIDSISRGSRSPLLHFAFALFVICDFYPLLPSPMIDVTTLRPAERVLASQPTGTTIVYPLATADELRTAEYLSDSRRFNQPLFNNVNPAFHIDELRLAMIDPTNQKARTLMENYGIRYILIRKDIYQEGRLPVGLERFYDPEYPQYLPAWQNGQAPDLSQVSQLKLLHEDQNAALYALESNPVLPKLPTTLSAPSPSPSAE